MYLRDVLNVRTYGGYICTGLNGNPFFFFCLGQSNNKSVPDHTWNNAIHRRPVENHLITGRFCRRD